MSEKVIFGKTGLEISRITLGTWGIGGAGWDSYSDEDRLDAIRAAVESGITLIDTAPAYNAALAEVALNWARQKDYVSTCVAGAQKRVRVEGNVKCLQWDLSAEEIAELNKALETLF